MRAALNRLSVRRSSTSRSPVAEKASPKPTKSSPSSKTSPTHKHIFKDDWPKKGDYAMVKLDDWARYYGSEVIRVHVDSDTVDLLLEDGERHRNVPRANIKRREEVELSLQNNDDDQFKSKVKFRAGDRVSCKIPGWNTWYDGYITKVNPDVTYVVTFDDGEVVSRVNEKEMKHCKVDIDDTVAELPDFVQLSARIEAKYTGWHKYYAGTVQLISDNRKSCTILFDDGELKTGVTASMVRSARTKGTTVGFDLGSEIDDEGDLRIGMRIMANPFSEWTKAYPGKIERKLNDGTFSILFDDGERVAGVSVEDIHQINLTEILEGPSQESNTSAEFSVGQNVEAKVGQWRKFYPGKIRVINADGTYVIEFLDGEIVTEVKSEEIRKSRQRGESTPLDFPDRPTLSIDQIFEIGERVAVKLFVEETWQRQWQGEIIRKNDDGSYQVTFKDGQVYSCVWPEEMERPNPGGEGENGTPAMESPAFDVGERVEAKRADRGAFSWYPGLIEDINVGNNTFIVQFDDGYRDVSVETANIRRMIVAGVYSDDSDDDTSSGEEELVDIDN